MKEKLTEFLLSQGPLILALLYSYLNGKRIQEQQELKYRELQREIEANHAQVEARYAGKSDLDVIKGIAGPGTGVGPKL